MFLQQGVIMTHKIATERARRIIMPLRYAAIKSQPNSGQKILRKYNVKDKVNKGKHPQGTSGMI